MRQYLIIQTTDIDKVDFNQVLETSKETVRTSVDNTKTFIKWDNAEPDFLSELTNTEGPYSHQEILIILSTEEWTLPLSDSMV